MAPAQKTLNGGRKTRRVVFLAFPDVVLLDLAGPWEVFNVANILSRPHLPPYQLQLISGGSASVASYGGLTLACHQRGADCRGKIDTLIVPAADPTGAARLPKRSIELLRRLAGRSRRVVSVCGGAFLLAAAGLLQGRKATTHWLVCDELAARFPEIDVEPDSLFVKDGNVYTSAGVTAGIDLALALVEEDLGRPLALNCARHLVMFMRRPGGQSQFSATLQSQQAARNPLNELTAWIADHPAADLSVERLAERVHMSVRNFARVFRREMGQTPAEFVDKLRVESARRLLEETDQTLDSIAAACGLGSPDSMRRTFVRVVRVLPTDYRRRFRR